MSRAAASSQTPQNPIWQLTVQTPHGKLRTCRTQQLGGDSFQIDESVLTLLTQFLLDYTREHILVKAALPKETDDTRRAIESKIAPIHRKFKHTDFTPIIWINILNIALEFGPSNSLRNLQQVAAANLSSRNQCLLLQPATSSLFPVIPIHINQLIEAILHGDEKMVRDLLKVAPKLLLKKGTAIDLQGRPFTGTPLQAAIAVDDIAPNTNSTGTVEIILEKLKQFDSEQYHAIFEEQARELYEKSLRVYISMQEKEIARLCKIGGELLTNDPQQTGINEKIRQAQANLQAYADAIRSNDLNTLFKTHLQAQADNAFDFQLYVDAILNAPQAEFDDVMALINAKTEEKTKTVIARTGVGPRESDDCRNKPFNQLTLVQKLNRFREKLTEHMQREIIFNPQHILTVLKANEAVWDTLPRAQDPNYHKCSVIFSQLCGFAQRLASEPVKQDIRQGTWYVTQENERRTRQSRFNTLDYSYNFVKNLRVDVSVSSVAGGVGYKFAAASAKPYGAAMRLVTAGAGAWPHCDFKTYVEQKQQACRKLITQRAQSTHCCSIQ